MSRAGRIIALAVHIGVALAAFTGSWWVWLETGLPCTAETALTLLCNPHSPLSQWVRLDVIGQCGIIAGIALVITGGNDGMFFLLERQARKQETARADKAVTEREQAVTERQQAVTEREQAVTERERAVTELKQAESERERAVIELKQAETGRQQDLAAMREWVLNLPEEYKDAIYTGTVNIGGIVWMRIDGKDHFGRRSDNGGWLMDSLPDLTDR